MSRKKIIGSSISDGIAIGTIVCLDDHHIHIPRFSISADEVEFEIQRYRKALKSSRSDLQQLQTTLRKEGSFEAVSIIDSHIQMLQDPYLTTMMEDRIQDMLLNTEAVFQTCIEEYEKQFSKVQNAFFQQRLIDVKDLSRRVLNHLQPVNSSFLDETLTDAIVVMREVVPSYTAEASKGVIQGFVSEVGTQTSHAALIARSKGIPMISKIKVADLAQYNGKYAIVDSNHGFIIISPTRDDLEHYTNQRDHANYHFNKLIQDSANECITVDGETIHVHANIQNVEDARQAVKYHASGVGLFRSEYVFLDSSLSDLSEDAQYRVYKEVFDEVAPLPFIIRIFDLGGDKAFIDGLSHGDNPALGLRSIRFLFKHERLFRQHLRAILRAAYQQEVSISIPFITDVNEVVRIRAMIRQVSEELRKESIPFNENMRFGCMIELPAAVMISASLAKVCDFFSIGTNDLIQFSLAVDRLDSEVAEIYQPCHPSIIQFLKIVISNANNAGIPVCLCGELASNTLYLPLLIGLGLREISCTPRFIPYIKSMVRKIHADEAKRMADEALTLGSTKEIYQCLSIGVSQAGDLSSLKR